MYVDRTRTSHRISLMAALAAAGLLAAACGQADQVPATSTSTSTSSSEVSPTEKAIDPSGGNKFTPPVTAPAAPNVPPGQHPGINGVP